MLLGADIGGTFTDLVWWTGERLVAHKLATTPPAPEEAVLAGMARLGANRPAVLLVHGSTVATNAFLERKGARVVFVTTAGFGDALEIGRQHRSALYDARAPKPAPLVPAERRVEVRERLDAQGAPLLALTDEEVARAAEVVAALRPEAVAICLLHSYANPAHEERLAEALRTVCPFVYTSSALDPAYREYERMSTTVLNAYVAPRVSAYVERLRGRLAGPLRLMGAHGGREPGAALERPANMILSGPAGGVVGAAAVARAAGLRDVITLDMGGTSTDVALIPGEPLVTREAVLEGLPLRAPMLDMATIGAGGGSLVRFDRGGALRVGPESAGAIPGPASYGRGGTLFTVTDAHLLLGHLLPEAFLGGQMALDVAAARAAGEAANAGRLASVEELAEGVLAVANAAMERAVRSVSARKGYDPADFTLVSFGGAGGLHAVDLARGLGMRGVLVPRLAGVLSALGMALADTLVSARTSVLRDASTLTDAELGVHFAPLVARCTEALQDDAVSSQSVVTYRSLEMRYRGQSYELPIPYDGNIGLSVEALHEEYERRFGYADPRHPLEVVNAVVTARAVNAGFPLPEIAAGAPVAPLRNIEAWFDGRPHATAVYRFESLVREQDISGPAILAGEHATALVPPGAMARIDRYGNAHLSW